MPSTTSSSVSSDFASSTVITPSLPTFFIASAMKRPISTSPLAEIVPTCAISSFEVTFLEFFWRSATTVSTARSTPRLRSIGFMPAATALAPSLTIACASTVAVVVPSPAWSEVFEATSRTICAPMFSNLSSSSISLATVTPSLVMRGAPNDLSSTTLRPLGQASRVPRGRVCRSRATFCHARRPRISLPWQTSQYSFLFDLISDGRAETMRIIDPQFSCSRTRPASRSPQNENLERVIRRPSSWPRPRPALP